MNVGEALRIALSSLETGDLGRASSICRQVLDVRPDQSDALHLLGVVALQQGDYERAFQFIEKAIRSGAENSSYFANLGEACRGLGRHDHAVSAFERALDIDPDRAQSHAGLGNLLVEMGRIDNALASYERALEINPTMAQVHYNVGTVYCMKGDHESAIAAFRRSIAINPSFAATHFNLGNTLQDRGDLTLAVTAYEDAVRLAPGFANAWHNMGNALKKLRRLDSARQAFERALELDASLATAHLDLGTIAKYQGRLDAALESFNRAIEIEPAFAAAHSGKAHVHLIQGKTDDAIAGFRKSIDLEPGFAWGYLGLSSALAEADRIPEAQWASQRAVRLRNTFEKSFKGRHAIGRVLILHAVETNFLWISPDDRLQTRGGTSNAATFFDISRFRLSSFYIDGCGPKTEAGVLPDCDVIFNAITDPDFSPRSLEIATMIAADASVPVVNRPEIVARTQRHSNYQSLRDLDGIEFPATVRVEERLGSKAQIVACLDDAGISMPVLVRRAGTHDGKSLEKAKDIEQLDAYFEKHREGPYYIAAFSDCFDRRGGYVKMRMFFVDGALYPSHFLVSKDWYTTVTPEIYELMSANEWMLASAKQFHADPEGFLGKDAYRALASIHTKLPLDYFGVDFTQLEDGTLLVFEANAAMGIPYLTTGELDPAPYRKPTIEATIEALSGLLEKKIEGSKGQSD